jgi:[protein-PII] uridylyltransferase
MVGRDIDDPAIIRDLASRVGTIETLKALTLLTFGDIDAVNPSAMTPWRLEQLWRVYLHTYNELTRELASDRIDASKVSEQHSSFLAGLPTRYLRTHSTEDIALHAALERQSQQVGVALDLKRRDGVYGLTVVAPDRPGLFACMTGALSAFGMNIVKAEAFSNANGNVVDTFAFIDPMRTLELNPAESDRLKTTVQRAALGREDIKKLLRARGNSVARRPPAKLQPTVAFESTASENATLVEIVAEDRPGLLYDLAATFTDAGCSIDVVLIDTEAHKAFDVFYVTANGAKLTPDVEGDLRQRLLQVCSG